MFISQHNKKNTLSLSPLALAIRASIFSLSLASTTTYSAMINVTTNTDDGNGCTLRDAITSLNNRTLTDGCVLNGTFGNNDLITFSNQLSSPNNIINITGEPLYIEGGRDISIDATDISAGIIIDATNQDDSAEVLNINNATLSINNLTLTGGQRSLTRLVIGDVTRRIGGGLVTNTSTVTLNNSTVSGNFSDNGGGIYSKSSIVTLNNSTVSENSTSRGEINSSNKTRGGGIFAYDSELILNNSTVSNNAASTYTDYTASIGGGIYANASSVTLNNSTISNNIANDGGGIYAQGDSTVLLNDSKIILNDAFYALVGYPSARGGGIFINSSTTTINNSIISDNNASLNGGGIRNSSGNVTLNNSTVSFNLTSGTGAGIHNFLGNMHAYNSTIYSNYSFGPGGGIFSSSSEVILSNTTISKNFAEDTTFSGAMFSLDSTVTLSNSTIAENLSNFFIARSEITISNSIIAKPTTDRDCLISGSPITVDTASIIQTDGCSIALGASRTGDPGLLPLANNGGPTQTHALSANSIARDTGIFSGAFEPLQSCTQNDQIGELRDINGEETCSVGAVEFVDNTQADFKVIPLPNKKVIVLPF